MKNFPFFLFSMLILSSCYNSTTTELTNLSTEVNETEITSKLSVPNFTSVCSHDDVKPMSTNNSLTVWGFDPLLSDKERKLSLIHI